MSGLDAGFLYMETPTLHMHTLKIGVIDPAKVPGGYSFARFREELEKRLHLLPPFRRCIVPVPLNLHHPVWIEDPRFDLSYHLRRIGAPPPAGPREMDEVIGEIASYPLDRSRPLWQIWVIEGLEEGHVAFAAKIHHALADGVAAAALLANVLSLDPEPHDPPPPDRPWRPEKMPSKGTLVLDAIRDWLPAWRTLPNLVRRTRRGVKAAAQEKERSDIRLPRPIRDVPKTSFNGSLSTRRVFATTTLSLEDFRKVRKAFGVTVNDIVLEIVGASVLRYLSDRGEVPDRALVAGVPVSTDRPDEIRRLGGNRVSNLFTSLCTDQTDPVERLHAISETMKQAKVVNNALGADLMGDWAELYPGGPFSWIMRTYSARGLAERHRPPFNMVVSNVPGPKAPLYIAGARLAALYSVGPILEGIGLNVTLWSYMDQMNFSAIADRELLPDLHRIVDGLEDGLDELLKAAERAEVI
jgi:WS/DGAT/MGAT family acyltransferase